MHSLKSLLSWIASLFVAAFGFVTLAHFEAVIQICVGLATIAMCVAAVRLNTLRRRVLEQQLKDEYEP